MASSSSSNAAPAMLGYYMLGKALGNGAFGQVILAVHVITQIKVAIKILSKKKMKDDGMIERVKKEIQNLEMLEHPHIIRLYEVIETTTAIYLVTELASGGELFDLISIKGKFTENEARSLFQQIISGIDYCSARGVVHRDLKPENIFLGEGGSIKIGDFGLSNTIKDGEFLTTFCGSREYAAPEILKGVAYAGSEVDVWSSGVILYALLTGSLPFSDDNVYLLTKKVLSGKFPMPSIIPEGAQDLIRKMLQVDPIKRIKVNEIMEHPWFKKNLPPYLSISAGEELENESDDENDEVDMEVVQQMIKIDVLKKIDKQRLVQGLQTVRGKKKNALRCTYELLLDVKLNKERLAQQLEIQSATSSFSASHQSNFAFSPSMTPTPPILSTPKQGVAATSQSIVSHTPSNPAAVAAVGKRRFFLGLQNESNRLTVMRKVFITLMALNCQWQICSPYHIICRWRPLNSNHFEAANAKEWIYVGLRVYKTDDKKYYLDFQRVGGCSNTFAFMELCSMIINHLTTSRKQSGASISSANPTAIPSNEAISADPSSMI